MNKQTRRAYILGLLTAIIIMVVGVLGYFGVKAITTLVNEVQKNDPEFIQEQIEEELANDSEGVESDSALTHDEKVEEILEYIDNLYYEDYDKEAIYEGMYEGMIKALDDKYATYYTTEDLQSMLEDSQGEYEGIGAVVSYTEDGRDIMVVAPYEDSPADQAGVIPNDVILYVDGVSTTDMEIDDAVSLIKGDKGTEVVLTIYRPATEETKDITVIRDTITAETVYYEMLDDQIGYLRLTGFQRVSPDQFREAIAALDAEGQEGMIIDLRNNPGGLLQVVNEIVDILLPEGLIVYTEDKNGNREEYFSTDGEEFDKPIVVLVNEYSASASEILSGAIKDRDAGEIVGVTTYGKGLVQNTFILDDYTAIKFTVERYFTPSGAYINGVGIEPDVEVPLEGELPYLFDTEKEDDIQLQEAIDVMEGILE